VAADRVDRQEAQLDGDPPWPARAGSTSVWFALETMNLVCLLLVPVY
jgi:hypothetical protein